MTNAFKNLRQNPKNVTFEELRKILEDHGFWLDRIAGSHHIFQQEIGERAWTLTIPFNRPIKIVYVKQVLEAIDQIDRLRPDNNEESFDDEDEN